MKLSRRKMLKKLFGMIAGTTAAAATGDEVPPQHLPHDQPINYVCKLWPELLPRIRRFCPDPMHWPILLGFSIQEIIEQGKQVVDPCLAARLVMESAIPLSKEALPELARIQEI